MRFRTAILALPLLLAGCFDASITMDLTEADTATGIVVTRNTIAMMPVPVEVLQESCTPDDAMTTVEAEVTETEFICTRRTTGTVQELIDQTGPFAPDPSDDQGSPAAVERIDDDTLRVTIDFSALPASPEDTEQFRQMIQANPAMAGMLEGRTITFAVRGLEIIETTGDVSGDGTEASISLPVIDIASGTVDFGPAFVTTVRVP